MTVTFLPIWVVDMLGAVLMIALSLMCLRCVRLLKRRDEENVIWTFLLWMCYGLTAFAVSRSAGHILKQVFFLFGDRTVWEALRPFTGAVNTFMLVFVAAVTLFFERVWHLYRQILKDRQALQAAHRDLVYLNQNLETRVRERTAAARASERKYRGIFESSQDMILVTSRDGLIRELNPAGYGLLGLHQGADGLKGRRFSDFFPGSQAWRDLLEDIDRRGFAASLEADLACGDGRKLRALVSATLSRGESPGDDTLHFMVKDIEKQLRTREQMAQADKLASIGELSAGIAHEINNPLGVILGYTQLMLRGEDPASERHGDLKTIEKQVRNCKSIVENLLSFARNAPPKKERVDIHEVIDDVLHFVQHRTSTDPVRIVTRYDRSAPKILLDERKIKQVLMNLVMNARHAVGRSGTIRLTTRYHHESGRLLLSVADTGCGIEKKNLARIFDPFFTTKPTGEGTGLGLSVSYGIVKGHAGHIHVESAPGKGSVFTVDLPVAAGHAGG